MPGIIKIEKKTINATIKIYCSAHHASIKELCPDCSELLNYALIRLEKCPYKENKTTCAKCPTHCYKPELREKIRKVMRYSGPRMSFKHPVLALLHFMHGRKKTV